MGVHTPRYGHQPIAMRRVEDWSDVENAGDFAFSKDEDGRLWIWVGIPFRPLQSGGYEVGPVRIPVNGHALDNGASWSWDGNEDKPTVKPSLHTIGRWHGWIRKGQLVEA